MDSAAVLEPAWASRYSVKKLVVAAKERTKIDCEIVVSVSRSIAFSFSFAHSPDFMEAATLRFLVEQEARCHQLTEERLAEFQHTLNDTQRWLDDCFQRLQSDPMAFDMACALV